MNDGEHSDRRVIRLMNSFEYIVHNEKFISRLCNVFLSSFVRRSLWNGTQTCEPMIQCL